MEMPRSCWGSLQMALGFSGMDFILPNEDRRRRPWNCCLCFFLCSVLDQIQRLCEEVKERIWTEGSSCSQTPCTRHQVQIGASSSVREDVGEEWGSFWLPPFGVFFLGLFAIVRQSWYMATIFLCRVAIKWVWEVSQIGQELMASQGSRHHQVLTESISSTFQTPPQYIYVC